ncbi:hypothetical protein J2P12_08960, partial [Candidatus Bathyarchaeota archaeon]|nr:hypothetical protein [Candidatus Bathyarchaeota archaeon]
FTNCEGVGNATTTRDKTQWVIGNNSAKIDTGPVTSALCIAPNVRQSTTCGGTSQPALICSFTYPLSNSSQVAFCMGMSGTGNTFTATDTLGHSFLIQQEVNTNVHVACGYSTNYTQLTYQQSGKDNVTLNFQTNTLNDSGAVYEVLGAGPANDGGPCAGTGTGTSFACNTSVTVAGYPLILSMVASTTPMTNYTPATHFVATPISSTANAQYENSSLIPATRCQSSNDNTVDYGMVCLFLGLKRYIGFSQFSQKINPTYNFTELTDSPSGFSFWFKLEPYNTNPMAGFEVRIFGGETQAELQYVFNPDPSVGQYTNITSGYYTYSLLFYGYKPGQWYHFSRNLRADWINLRIPVTTSFNGIQFEGFSTLSGNTVKSETIWIDDVRAYAYGTGPIPTPSSRTNFNLVDSTGIYAGNSVQWRLLDNQGQPVTYTLGLPSLPPGPYYLQAYYRAIQPGYLIYQQQIHLNTTLTIPLPLFPNPAGTYIALNDSSITTTAAQTNTTALRIIATGTTGK